MVFSRVQLAHSKPFELCVVRNNQLMEKFSSLNMPEHLVSHIVLDQSFFCLINSLQNVGNLHFGFSEN